MAEPSIMVFIPAFNCQNHIKKVLGAFPTSLWGRISEVVVVDDCSKDRTSKVAENFKKNMKEHSEKLTIIRNKKNLRYGGVQKSMYSYAQKKKYDYVVMLHGDNQHKPKELPRFFPEMERGTDFITGSRIKGQALQGGMPFYKFLGNRLLTTIENAVLWTSISDFHCGYRAIRTASLKGIPFERCSDNYHFDSEILFQFVLAKRTIGEVVVSTVYEDETSGVRAFKYGSDILKSLGIYSLAKYGLRKDARYSFKKKR